MKNVTINIHEQYTDNQIDGVPVHETLNEHLLGILSKKDAQPKMKNVIKNIHELFIDTLTDGALAHEILNEHLLGIVKQKVVKNKN